MSKPIFQDLFTWSGRRNRQSFILQQLAFVAIIIAGAVLSGIVALVIPVVGGILYFTTIIVGFILLVSSVAAIAQRIRDVGYPGWWAVIMLVPFLNLAFTVALWIAPSESGENKFGPALV